MRDHVRRRRIAAALSTSAILMSPLACERDSTPPAGAPSAPLSSQPTDADLSALRSVFPETHAHNSLPVGHPPISGAAGSAPRSAPQPQLAPIELRFDAPADWQAQVPRSTMRKAQYLLPRAAGDSEDGELVVFYFGPGEGGGVRDNIERWRGWFTSADGAPLPPEASREESFSVGDYRVTLLDVVGRYAPGATSGMPDQAPRDNFRMFAAIIETGGGAWFIRATGPAPTMANHWQAVKQFISSARP